MADQGTIDVIREALADSGAVELDHVEIVLDEGAVVLRGAVSTTEQATRAEMVAEQHADEVRNLLRVDPGLREDHTDPATVAGDAARRAADDGLPGELQDGVTSDITEALGENVPWDPPTEPSLAPTAAEQRGVQDHAQEPEAFAEPGADGDGETSLPEVSQAELEQDARPGR